MADKKTTHAWGLKDEQWWLVVSIDGEPVEAYHAAHGRIDATRDMFTEWRNGDLRAVADGAVVVAVRRELMTDIAEDFRQLSNKLMQVLR